MTKVSELEKRLNAIAQPPEDARRFLTDESKVADELYQALRPLSIPLQDQVTATLRQAREQNADPVVLLDRLLPTIEDEDQQVQLARAINKLSVIIEALEKQKQIDRGQ